MRQSSRSILRQARGGSLTAPQPTGAREWLILGFAAGGMLVVLRFAHDGWWQAIAILFGFYLWTLMLAYSDRRKFLALASKRHGESICTFARSFPKAERDPLLIRAVYEGIQGDFLQGLMPLRATDRFETELAMDGDDLEDWAEEIAGLTGRRWDETKSNPYYGKVNTPADLVAFLRHQPLR